MTSDVSVVIPAYNRADLISATLISVFNQTCPPGEVIVVDDGSYDNTEAVIKKQFPAVKYVRIPNGGDSRARNAGASLAAGRWLAFLDSDDLWREDKLEMHARLVAAVPALEYSFSNFSTVVAGVWSESTKLDCAPDGFFGGATNVGPDLIVWAQPLYERLFRFQPIFPSSVVMTQDCFRRSGGWNDKLGRVRSGDFEFHLRCVRHAPIGAVTAPVVGVRKHGSNFSGDPLITTLGELEILRFVLANHEAAASCSSTIQREIARRSAAAAELAFEHGDFRRVRSLLESVPPELRSSKLKAKAAISNLPDPLAAAACRTVLGLASLHRIANSSAGNGS